MRAITLALLLITPSAFADRSEIYRMNVDRYYGDVFGQKKQMRPLTERWRG